MKTPPFLCKLILSTCLTLAFSEMVAQESEKKKESVAPLPDSFSKPMPLYEAALGTFTRPISRTAKPRPSSTRDSN